MKIRTYSELSQIDSFVDRFKYLSLRASVGVVTFGYERHLNQKFYKSRSWQDLREHVIVRDNGCDLGILGYEIFDKITIHHMNPMSVEDVVAGDSHILDPEFLICVTHQTHNAIHYGDEKQLPREFVERKPGDTLLWRRQ